MSKYRCDYCELIFQDGDGGCVIEVDEGDNCPTICPYDDDVVPWRKD